MISSMKKSRTISLSKAIIFPYFGMALFFLAFALLVYFLVAKLHNEHESLYRKAITDTAVYVDLFDGLQQIQNDVNKVINEKNLLVAEFGFREIKNNLNKLLKSAGERQINAVWREQENIMELLSAYGALLQDVEKYVAERNALVRERFKNLQEIRYVGVLMRDFSNENKIKEQHLLSLANMVLNDLLLLNSDVPMFYAIKIYNSLLFYFSELKKETGKLQNAAWEEILNRLSLIMLDGNSTLFLKWEQLYNKETSLLIYLNSLSRQTGIVSSALFEELYVAAEEQNTFMRKIMDHLSWFSIFISVFFVFSIFLAFRFLSAHVLHPVQVLGTFIKQRSDNVNCSFVDQKVEEVRDISCAVYDFVNRIEENEKNLRESHQNLEKQVLERTAEIRRLSEKIINVSEEERFKLAAELHDDIGSSIGTIKFGIEHALCLLNNSEMDNARESLDSSVQIVKSVARQLRRIQTDLRPPHLDLGLLKTLEWYVEDFKTIHPAINVQADFFFDELLLSTSMQIVTYRIIQEGLNNVAKHSKATEVLLQVLYDEDYSIVISDNGVGLEQTKTKEGGNGLKNIRERVKVSGGEFIIDSSSEGTTITALWKNLDNM